MLKPHTVASDWKPAEKPTKAQSRSAYPRDNYKPKELEPDTVRPGSMDFIKIKSGGRKV